MVDVARGIAVVMNVASLGEVRSLDVTLSLLGGAGLRSVDSLVVAVLIAM